MTIPDSNSQEGGKVEDGYRTSADGLTRTKVAPDAAAPMVPSESVTLCIGADGRLKPWQKTTWTCARARVDHEGMHCPDEKCADCPNRRPTPSQEGRSSLSVDLAKKLADGYEGSTCVTDFHGAKITLRYVGQHAADQAHQAICDAIDAVLKARVA